MFGLNILNWNASYGCGNYSKSLHRVLFGGSPGHSSAELIIPITPENILRALGKIPQSTGKQI